MGMVQSLLKLAGLNWPTPDNDRRKSLWDCTVCRRQTHLHVVVPCRPTTSGLHLLIDGSGIKMLGEVLFNRPQHTEFLTPITNGGFLLSYRPLMLRVG